MFYGKCVPEDLINTIKEYLDMNELYKNHIKTGLSFFNKDRFIKNYLKNEDNYTLIPLVEELYEEIDNNVL